MSVHEKLLAVQTALKAPKGQYNAFGKYYYRSCEDIQEAVKPLLCEHKLLLMVTDTVELIGDRYYVKATACVQDAEKPEEFLSSSAYAREEDAKKGMDGSQITGSASSYARKYALNGLLCIDDAKDSDSQDNSGQPEPKEYICPECGKKIVGVKSKSGKTVTAEELYQSCGMCYHCYQDKKAAEQSA